MASFIREGYAAPATCTLELSNGHFVHVDHEPSHVKACIDGARSAGLSHGGIDQTFITVTRVSGSHSRSTRGFLEMDIAWREIVAIHPLQSRGEAE